MSDGWNGVVDSESADGTGTVGRTAELRTISGLFERLGGGAGSFLQIVGEPGIGKTHLLAAVREMAVERGIDVLSGRAGEFEQRMPFQVLIEALHDRIGRVGLNRLVTAEAADMLASLIAEPWGAVKPGLPPGRDVDFDRFQLFQALRQLLVALAAKPLVVMFDDVHWADPGSIDFISFLSRHPIAVPLLIVVSHRDRQAPAQLRYELARNNDHGSVTRIELGPLSRTEAAALICRRPSSRTLEELYRESQGNPLYLLTLGRRAASRSEGGPAWRGGDISSRLESLILGEIASLSAQELVVASAAAVIGDRFPADLLAGVCELPEGAVFSSLRRLVERDLIRSEASGPALAFRHPLVRSVVYNRTDPVWRMGAHRRSLIRLNAFGAPAVSRAHHIEHGATEWTAEQAAVLEQAGHESMSTSPLSAAHWFDVELRLMPETADFAGRRFKTSYLRARALCLGGRFSESRDLLHKILYNAPAQAAIDRSSAVVLCAHAEQRLGRYAEAIALLRQEIGRLGDDQAAISQRMSLCLELGLTALLANDYAAARPNISWALGVARSTGDALGEASALAYGAFGEICTGQADLARQGATEAAKLVDGLPDAALVDEREALSMLGWAEILLERYADAERHLARGRAIIRRTGQSHGLPQVQLGQCLVSMFTGRMSEALERAEDAEDAALLVGSDHLLGIVLGIKAPILVWVAPRGEGKAALEGARRATSLFTGGAASSWWGRTALLLRGHAELANGDPRTCVDLLLKGGGEDLRQLGAPLLAEYAEILVGALLKLGEVRRADGYARDAVEFAAELGLAGQRAHAARALGLVLAADGDPDGAWPEFQRAERWFDQAGKAVEQARTAVFAARTLGSLDRVPEAVAMLDRARGQAVACGAPWVRDEITHVRAQLTGAEAVLPAQAAGPPLALLTGRERQVARLVERGHTNRQIAGTLRLSERTVESHLANVYRKLGVTTRTALAAVLGAAAPHGAASWLVRLARGRGRAARPRRACARRLLTGPGGRPGGGRSAARPGGQ